MKIFVTILFALCIVACSDQSNWPHTTFSSEDWQRTPEAQRYKLVTNLLERHLLDGKSKAQVIELLGQPSDESVEPRSLAYIIKTGGNSFDQILILDIRFEDNWDHATLVGIRGD